MPRPILVSPSVPRSTVLFAPDLDVVLDDHAAELGHLPVRPGRRCETETVSAEDDARVNHTPGPDAGSRVQHHAGHEDRVRPDRRSLPDHDARADDDAVIETDSCAHDGKGTDRDVHPDRGPRKNASIRRNTGIRPPHGVHPVEDLGQSEVGIGGHQKIPSFDPGVGADENRAGPRLLEIRPISRVGEEGQIVRGRFLESGHAEHATARVAVDAAGDGARQFREKPTLLHALHSARIRDSWPAASRRQEHRSAAASRSR